MAGEIEQMKLIEGVCETFNTSLDKRFDVTMQPEKNKHDRMKLLGRKILFYMGIPQSHIREEETVDYNGKKYRVDLIGYPTDFHLYGNSDFSIAIECGDNKAEKIEALRHLFPLVLILPYKEFDVEMSEIAAISKLTERLQNEMITNHRCMEEIRAMRKEFEITREEEFKAANNRIKEFQKEMDELLKKEKNLMQTSLDLMKQDIKFYENDLKHIKDFKEFCLRFGRGY